MQLKNLIILIPASSNPLISCTSTLQQSKQPALCISPVPSHDQRQVPFSGLHPTSQLAFMTPNFLTLDPFGLIPLFPTMAHQKLTRRDRRDHRKVENYQGYPCKTRLSADTNMPRSRDGHPGGALHIPHQDAFQGNPGWTRTKSILKFCSLESVHYKEKVPKNCVHIFRKERTVLTL